MPLARSAITWLRRTFSWSSSVQSWQERIADAVLIGGMALAAIISFVFSLQWWQILLTWAICLLPAFALSLLGWLKLFGPVLYYDMIRQARRSRFIVLRFLYALLLVLLFLSVSLNASDRSRVGLSTRMAADITQNYFEVFMLAQFMTVVLLTPAYVAGAISDEKDRKTLEFMLATDLLNREIVLSKLFSRLSNLALVVLTGLPILSILQFLGGVDPNLILAGFVVTAMTILGQAGVSILFSVLCKKPRESISLAYLAVVAYYCLITVFFMAVSGLDPAVVNYPFIFNVSLADVFDIVNKGNLISFIGGVQRAGSFGTLATELPKLVGAYAAFHGVIAVSCTILAIVRIRQVALNQSYGKPIKSGARWSVWRRPPVSANPMIWKEVYCDGAKRSGWIARILLFLLFAATFGPVAVMLWNYMQRPYVNYYSYDGFAREMNVWVRVANVTVGCLTFLSIGVRASTSITTEREKQTFDTLLTTPMDSNTILFGKWVGSILGMSFGMIWLALIWAAGIVTGGLHLAALPCVMIAWFVYAAFAATLGLWFSTVCRSSLQATIFTIMSMIGLFVGHWLIWICCGALMLGGGGSGRGAEWILKAQAGILTPPFVLGALAFTGQDLPSIRDRWENTVLELAAFSAAGLVFWSIAAAVLYSATNARLRFLTLRQGLRSDNDGGLYSDFRKAHSPIPMMPWSTPSATGSEDKELDDEDEDEDVESS